MKDQQNVRNYALVIHYILVYWKYIFRHRIENSFTYK